MTTKSNKWPKWLKWGIGISFSFLFLMVFLVFRLQEKQEITTWNQWEKHRENLKSFSNNVMIYRNATEIYLHANNYFKDEFYQRCNLDACAEYRAFIRAAREASADGVLNPQELVGIADLHNKLKVAIASKDIEFKKKFNK